MAHQEKYIEIKEITYCDNTKKTYVTLIDNSSIELKYATHLVYEGAFGITKKFLNSINPKLKEYVPCHHVLYLKEDKILHYTGGDNLNSKEAEVIIDTINNFKKGALGKMFMIVHSNNDTNENIDKRCKEIIGQKKYNLFNNNCEDIVYYCLTGKKKSKQREKIFKAIISYLKKK